MQKRSFDGPDLVHYREANARVRAKQAGVPRMLFYGTSITQLWGEKDSSTFFPSNGYLNPGIRRQTNPQQQLRFREVVIVLQPDVVVIPAGTSDIASSSGPSTQAMIEDNHAQHGRAGLHTASVWRWPRCGR